MRIFVDFNIRPTDYSKDSLLAFIDMALHLKYRVLVVEALSSTEAELIKSLNNKRVKLYVRHTVTAHTSNEFKSISRKIKWADLIVAECSSQETARIATKIRNVDAILIPLDKISIVNERQINAMKMKERSLEIRFADIIHAQKLHNMIGLMTKNLINVVPKIPVIVSSGARNPSEMRSPKDMAAILSVIGIDQDRSLDTVSKNPYLLLRRFL
ncbi:MAG: RNase P subunit p30 family protein [Thermoprotei archaeon]